MSLWKRLEVWWACGRERAQVRRKEERGHELLLIRERREDKRLKQDEDRRRRGEQQEVKRLKREEKERELEAYYERARLIQDEHNRFYYRMRFGREPDTVQPEIQHVYIEQSSITAEEFAKQEEERAKGVPFTKVLRERVAEEEMRGQVEELADS